MLILIKLVFLFLASALFLDRFIRFSHQKRWFQPIYHLSPGSHQSKIETPSIGGVSIVISLIIAALLFRSSLSAHVGWLVLITVLFAFIGFVDDIVSIKSGSNKGLSARQKLIIQLYFSGVCIVVYSLYIHPISWWVGVFYAIVMTGASNATNLTDGLDGLLGGSMIISLVGFLMLGWIEMPLSILLFIGIVISIMLSFLVFNRHPARVFMGDTGSLAMGALLTGIALLYDRIWILIPFGMVYIIETLSVIIQVVWYKRTQNRFFLMAPLHHHFEKLGMREPNIVVLFWIIGIIGVFLGVLQ